MWIKVSNDFLVSCHLSALLLDLNASFDTVHYNTLYPNHKRWVFPGVAGGSLGPVEGS